MDKNLFFYYNSDTMKSLHLKIYGQVQGIFYRDTTCQKAKQLDITGWIKNCPDNTVEIVAEGQEEDLKKLLTWCKTGPELAEVEGVEEKWEDIDKTNFVEFKIVF